MINRIMFVALGLLLTTTVHAAGNPAAGAEKSKPCQACHGVDGNGVGNPIYPILAGQYPDYLAQALKNYRSGERVNVIMQGMAGALSDEDIADLTAYFGSQPSKLTDLAER